MQRTLCVINQNGKNMKRNKYMRITEALCRTAEIITTLQINYTSIKLVKIFLKDGGRERAFKEGCLAQAETQRQGHRRNLQERVGSTIRLGKTGSWPRLQKGVVERPWMRDDIPGDRELQPAGETGNDVCNKPRKVGNLDYLFLSLSAEPGLQ